MTCRCGGEVPVAGPGSKLGLCPGCYRGHSLQRRRNRRRYLRTNRGWTTGGSGRRSVLNAAGMMVEVATLARPKPVNPKNPRYHGR